MIFAIIFGIIAGILVLIRREGVPRIKENMKINKPESPMIFKKIQRYVPDAPPRPPASEFIGPPCPPELEPFMQKYKKWQEENKHLFR